ncbi:hypothetical protein [Luteitalea sp. TBR-22]|uniref:hypothetical protein n=1 Tax=Luteitalea sp. TBR-22 TaxID=2802971 RepID=UPI001EF49ECE|nr:hypothetical protein [Luteitalea sp. TBR-22]
MITVALAVPSTAWLPYARGPATADAWNAALTGVQGGLAAAQIAVGATVGSGAAIAGAVLVAAALGAATTAILARALLRSGLSPLLASLLAIVAAAAPLSAWQASSPLGAGPLTMASTLALWWLVSRPSSSLRAGVGVPVALVALLAVAEAVAHWRHGSSLGASLQVMREDLGLIGLTLLPAWLGPAAPQVPRRWAWLGLVAVTLVTTPLTPALRAAVLLPWAWWLVGAGIAQLVAWRGRWAGRWAVAGLIAWATLHSAQVPWGHQRQQAALVRTWAEGVAAHVSPASPLVVAPSAQGLLARALVPEADARTVAPEATAAAARAGRRPILVDMPTRDRLRWQGVALDEVGDGLGAPLEAVLEALPRGIVAVAVISQDAAARLSAPQWRALARIGLRLADAGQPRAHAVVGLTGTRVEGLEVAQAGSARLDMQPGDPLGRTGARAPVDLRLEAGSSRVSAWLRGQPVLEDERGLALLFFSTRGDFLAWRSGPLPSGLDGPALGGGPRTRSQVITSLPCVDIAPDRGAAIGHLAQAGALGLVTSGPGTIDVRLTRASGISGDVRLATRARPDGPTLSTGQHGSFALAFPSSGAMGLLLRGAVTDARATSTVASRVCAAWPMLHPLEVTREPIEMRVAPSLEAHFGYGWHDAEVEPGMGQFRWMAGGRADLLFAFRSPGSLVFALDAQGPGAPEPGDTVTLAVNGVGLAAHPLMPTRGIYEWPVEATHLHAGPNTFTLITTRTRRPADLRPGADGRTLGLLVRGWTIRRQE